MLPRKTKAELRAELQAQVEAFVRSGGEVQHIPRGQSGVAKGDLIRPVFNDGKPRETRTACDEVLKTIDARRLAKEKPRLLKKLGKPKRKVIYDDFGEPLREVWE